MALDYGSILSSKTFRFLVGKEKVPFTIHAGALEGRSEPLLALVNGQMLESKESCACLDDTDEQTFIRFAEYFYTDDYNPALPEVLLDASHIAQEDTCDQEKSEVENHTDERVEQPDDAAFTIERPHKKTRKVQQRKKSVLWQEFLNSIEKHERKVNLVKYPANDDPCEDYTEVFLSHAQVYVFGDRYDIEALKKLVLSRLGKSLASFTIHKERTDDIVDLLVYAYSNTPDCENSQDKLRELIVTYVACVVESLADNETFKGFLGENNKFSSDLLTVLLKRLD